MNKDQYLERLFIVVATVMGFAVCVMMLAFSVLIIKALFAF